MSAFALLLAVIESLLAGVVASAALTWFYNNFLSGLRESHLKKAFSLLVHPVGVAAAVTHFLAIWIQIPRFWPVAFIGAGIILWRWHHWRRQERLNHGWESKALPSHGGGINWAALPGPARFVLRLIAPFNQVDRPQIITSRQRLRGLHPDMEGYRIVFLTDFHVHRWMNGDWFRAVVEEALRLKPDVVILGGDFVSRRQFAELAIEVLGGLRAAPRLLAVRGNHDFWTRPGYFADAVDEWGGTLLSNEVAVLRRGAGTLAVVGLETPYLPLTQRQRREIALRLEAAGAPRFGVVHTPQAYAEARSLGCQFAIAGHTHGGQVRLPFFGTTISSCAGRPEFLWGAGRLGSMGTFTSNGVGAFYPLRINCPPQIVLIELAAR